MHLIRRLFVGAISATLAITALGAPAMAADRTLHLVNGHPGKKLAICVDGKRVVKALPYGKKVTRKDGGAKARVKILQAGPRTASCKGKVLGKRTVTFGSAIVIVTKRKPWRIMVLDNTPAIGATGFVFRHNADLGPVSFLMSRSETFPSASQGTIEKGAGAAEVGPPSQARFFQAILLREAGGAQRRIAGPKLYNEVTGRPRAVILVGTKLGNARVVSFLVEA